MMINDSTKIRVIPAVWLVLFHSDFKWFSRFSNVGKVTIMHKSLYTPTKVFWKWFFIYAKKYEISFRPVL